MRFQKIMKHPLFKQSMNQIVQMETERIYCKHGIEHCLDVARICALLLSRNSQDIDFDFIYAIALLHDLGRSQEGNHCEASVKLAKIILPDCDYSENEIEAISQVIKEHSGRIPKESLEQLLQKKTLGLKECFKMADQLSRNCFCCQAADTCKWAESERTQTIVV